ncbi:MULTISPECIES: adenosylmethionine decarboxylase [Neisseria]|uniref:adenosylmethionine decarboxylase n=1 Tax=Neisseria TaxID=482 RepID=UPI0006CE78C6|nr:MULTISPECIES: adenosylmethionine decarboxylase [Neisseria]KPN71832.1 S-adenosylmethionine decarboxylase proenzyme [Neisseria sp. 83E34]
MSYQPSSHGLLDLYGCDAAMLRDEACLKNLLRQAAEAAGATVLGGHFHRFGGEGGVTGVLLLAESHISIHTWPEHSFAALDIFLCGEMQIEQAKRFLCEAFQPKQFEWRVEKRGAQLGQLINNEST